MNLADRAALIAEADRVYNSGRASEAVALFAQVSFDPSERDGIAYAEFCNAYGSALAESGQPAAAEGYFAVAERVFLAHEEISWVGSVNFNRGNVARYINDFGSARQRYKLAFNIFNALGNRQGILAVSSGMATMALDRGELDLAQQILTDAQQLVDEGYGDQQTRWSMLFLRARLTMALGDVLTGAALLKRAKFIARKHLGPDYVNETVAAEPAVDVIVFGRVFSVLKRSSRRRLSKMEEAFRSDPGRGTAESLFTLAHMWAELGDLDRASAVYEECVESIDLLRGSVGGELKNELMAKLAYVAHVYCLDLQRHGETERALAASELGQGRSLLDRMFRHQIKRQGGRRISAVGNGLVMLQPPSIDEVRDLARESGLHILKFIQVHDTLLGWFVDVTGSVVGWEAPDALGNISDLLGEINTLRRRHDLRVGNQITVEDEEPDWDVMEHKLGRAFRELLPVGVRDILRAGEGRLLIVPHQSSFHLPWAYLGDEGGFRIGQRWQVTLTTSIGVFLQADPRRDVEPDLAGNGTVAIAAQLEHRITVETAESEETELWFPSLTGTVAEAALVAQTMTGQALTSTAATATALVNEMATAGILHIAAHGYWDPSGEIPSFILLDHDGSDDDAPDPQESGTTVDAESITDCTTTASLVVLSGCQTGLGLAYPDSYVNIPNAFLIAGARSVLMTLWPISDGSAVEFFRVFYRHLRDGRSAAESLASAQQDLDGLLDPWEIAAFVLIGHAFRPIDGQLNEGPIFCSGDVFFRASAGERLDLSRIRDVIQTRQTGFDLSADYQLTAIALEEEAELYRARLEEHQRAESHGLIKIVDLLGDADG